MAPAVASGGCAGRRQQRRGHLAAVASAGPPAPVLRAWRLQLLSAGPAPRAGARRQAVVPAAPARRGGRASGRLWSRRRPQVVAPAAGSKRSRQVAAAGGGARRRRQRRWRLVVRWLGPRWWHLRLCCGTWRRRRLVRLCGDGETGGFRGRLTARHAADLTICGSPRAPVGAPTSTQFLWYSKRMVPEDDACILSIQLRQIYTAMVSTACVEVLPSDT